MRLANEDSNPLLFRVAFKMATGSGKTVVMAMLIAWHTLNKLANPQDARFSDTFLIVTPGITIRDRLRVLLPSDPQNYYRQHDIVPPHLFEELGKAKILVTNFHAFKPRVHTAAGKIAKSILKQGETDPFTESPDQMVRRVCRELGNKKNIVVINDEAHHCYRRKPDAEEEKLIGDERKEAEKRDEEARIWISGLEAVKAKIGVKVTYDLSATPFFLRGSGYPEGTLFRWVVSDFSLIDAIESGIVKVPRVPVADNTMEGEQPTFRDLWLRIREDLPKKGRGTDGLTGEPTLPAELEGALQSLYSNYEKYFKQWQQNADARAKDLTPPVFIVVCNNTNVSKLVFDHVAGWEKKLPDDSTVLVPGKLSLFSNVDGDRWSARPNSILIDSEQLESGEGMSPEFKQIAAREIEEFQAECRERFPGRDVDSLTEEDLLREVMNTVGKQGKLGEHVRCVVSVSMLTEGWDANTVTHILGVRAFGTQLLCEQVVGRGLRRMSYAVNGEGMFNPEYAEVYGVPFSFIPCSGSTQDPKPGPTPTHVRALEDRIACEITFPRVIGYRYDLPGEKLKVKFTKESGLALSTRDLPTKTEMSSIVGETSFHTLYGLKSHREQEIDFLLAKLVLEKYFRDDQKSPKIWLFPQLLPAVRQWREQCVTCKDDAFPQMLLLAAFAHDAADRIYRAIVASADGENSTEAEGRGRQTLKPILRPYDTIGSTRYVDFDTTRPVYATNPKKCHISHVVADTESWEQKMAQTLEDMPEVICYVKNQNLGFTVPYTLADEERQYIPDFIVRVDDGHGRDDLLNLIVEVSGEARKEKAAKVATARTLWIPAINNHGGYPSYFELLSQPLPGARDKILARLNEDRMIMPNQAGHWDITNLGAILFAKNLDSFRGLSREAVRVIVYEGKSRLKTIREQVGHADTELLYDQPYEDGKRIRVTGPFTVESLSPHRVLATDENRPATETASKKQSAVGQFETMILESLKTAGVQNTLKGERLKFDRLESFSNPYLHAVGEYSEVGSSRRLDRSAPNADGRSGGSSLPTTRRVAICIGPEHGTVSPELVKEAAKEAVQGVGFDLLVVCGFAFDPHVSEEIKRYGKLQVLIARMNPDLAMGDELLKKTGAGNLFMVFGELDMDVKRVSSGVIPNAVRNLKLPVRKDSRDSSQARNDKLEQIVVTIKGVDVYDPTTGQIRNSSTDDIACWFIDTDYNGESFFVRQAYFTGADEPYEKLKRALRAEIDEAAWQTLYSTTSRPFPAPKTGKIAVKVINHYGDEVLKVWEVK